MDNRRFGIFDEVKIGSGLALTAGDLILQTALSVDANRHARSDIAVILTSYVDLTLYNPNRDATPPSFATVSGVPAAVMGFVLNEAPLNAYVGFSPASIGYCPYDGNLLINNVAVVTIETATYNDTMRFMIDPQRMLLTISKNNNVILDSYDISAFGVQPWYFAATVSGEPGELGVNAVTGYTPFQHPLSGLTGFWIPKATIAPINLGNEPWMANKADARRHEKFAGDINAIAQLLEITDSVKLWTMGASAPADLGQGGSLQVQIDDPNDIYEHLLDDSVKGEDVDLFKTQQGGTFADGYQIWAGIFDSCEQDTRQTKQVFFRGPETRLAIAMIRSLFAPYADAGVAGKQRTVSDGVARNYTPDLEYAALVSTGLPSYAMSDAGITAIGRVRVNGVETFDYTFSTDNENINPGVAPTGEFTVETSSYGDVIDPDLPDLLSGDGHFESAGTLGGGLTYCTSGSSLSVATGSKSFTVITPFGSWFVTGSQIKAASRGTPAATMTGTVTSHSATGVVVNVTSVTGSGTHNDWNISGGQNQPTGWTGAGYGVNTLGAPGTGFPDNSNHWQIGGTAPNQYVTEENNAGGISWFYRPDNSITIKNGYSYGVRIKVLQNPYFGPVTEPVNGSVFDTPPNFLIFGYTPSVNIQFFDYKGQIVLNKDIPTSGPTSGYVVYEGVFTNNTGIDQPFVMGMNSNETVYGSAGNFTKLRFQYIELYELPALNTNIILSSPGFRKMAQGIVCDRGPLQRYEMSDTDGDAIDNTPRFTDGTIAPYTYGYHIAASDSAECDDQLDLLCASVNAVWWFDDIGDLRFAKWFKPENVADEDIDHICTSSDVVGEIIGYDDAAENLRTRCSGCKNYNPLQTADTNAVSTDDLPLTTRAQLAEEYQWTVTAGVNLAERYRISAQQGDPQPTILDRQPDGQDHIEEANDFYSVGRRFYVGMFVEPFGTQYQKMQTMNLTYGLKDFKNGKKVIIIGRTRSPTKDQSKLVLWG